MNTEFKFLQKYYEFFIKKNDPDTFASVAKQSLVDTNQISIKTLNDFVASISYTNKINNKRKEVQILLNEIKALEAAQNKISNTNVATNTNSIFGDPCGRIKSSCDTESDSCGHTSRSGC